MPTFNLLVLRTPDPDTLANFYLLLGLTFEKHRHGTGPEHYAAELGPCVLEIYPGDLSMPARLGFEVENLNTLIAELVARGTPIIIPPKESPWGYRAVIQDPVGTKIELVERNH
jgi:hypothetical protein